MIEKLITCFKEYKKDYDENLLEAKELIVANYGLCRGVDVELKASQMATAMGENLMYDKEKIVNNIINSFGHNNRLYIEEIVDNMVNSHKELTEKNLKTVVSITTLSFPDEKNSLLFKSIFSV